GAAQFVNHTLAVAKQEIAQWKHFDYLLISTSIREDVRRMQAIYDAEKMRQPRSTAPEV
ncbi:MAG: guanylate kinase, partial [Verrucomicrobia bacterium]|nr:guanylate kinase [Verrucomicrobiota bacterium]